MDVGKVTRRAKEVFISKSVRPYRVSASTVVTVHHCCHPALSRMTVYRNQFSRSSQPWSSCGPAPFCCTAYVGFWHSASIRGNAASVALGGKRKIDGGGNGSRLMLCTNGQGY